MPAYIIADIEVTDPAGYEEYKQKAFSTITASGGGTWLEGVRPKYWRVTGCPAV